MAKDHALEFGQDDPDMSAQGQAPADADHLVELAKLQPLTDGGLRTADLLSEALTANPQHHEARILRERLYQMFVPRWHFPMLADETRNRAYAKAIAAKVRPGDIVLDIGSGAGLTAMLAARAGAKHVYTCEQQPLIARAAKQVIAANGLSDRITVLSKASYELYVGVDLPEPADVVISEVVDTMLLGEGALATLAHAMSDLAKPGARTVPESGMLKAQLVQSDRLKSLWRPSRAEGFDLSDFHHFANVAQITQSDFATFGLRALGPAAPLFAFDFARPEMSPAHCQRDLSCDRSGTAHAVLVFFEMTLADGIGLTNGLEAGGHWGRTAFLLPEAVQLAAGQSCKISAEHDTVQFSLTPVDACPLAEPASRVTEESEAA